MSTRKVTVADYDRQLEEIDREVAMRRRLYPQWVARGTLQQSTADAQIERLMEARETVRQARQDAVMTGRGGKRIDNADELLAVLRIGVAVVEDFMPNISRCALQDYGRLNEFLVRSKKLVE